MSSKLIDNNRRSHAAKALAKASKKNQSQIEGTEEGSSAVDSKKFSSLNDQYLVIRKDILKLREDLAHGYDLLKDYFETKVNLRSLIRIK